MAKHRSRFERPITRPLKAYAFDPSQGKLLGNEMTLNVRYQELDPGPVVTESCRDGVAVVDYDGANQRWYEPVDLDDRWVLIRGGLNPSESDPRFHQQMVYAVATDTIQHFEAALGRRIHWRREERAHDSPAGPLPGDIHRLNLYPHAMIAANAFYSPKAHGILFGYFRAGDDNPGRNLSGQTVFTCLSHDIVVHETTHAIIDGIRGFFTEQSNVDVPAFHEALADIAALFRHFTHREVMLDTLQRTGGLLHRYQLRPDIEKQPGQPAIGAEIPQGNPLIALAQQFGEARGQSHGLRSALGTEPDPRALKTALEPHARGAILVAAVFDAYFSIYVRRTADLFRIYRAGGGSENPVELPGTLAGRLCAEAGRTADQFFRVFIRALDYCPPVDLTLGDYLRAVVTSACDLHQNDEDGFIDAVMDAFRRRGILPETASFFSENAVAWPPAESLGVAPVAGLEFGDPNGLTFAQKEKNAEVLRRYGNDAKNMEKLGLDPELEVTVPSFHPVFRINPDGSLRTDMVVEMVQRKDVAFDPANPRLGAFPMRGGATLIISKPTIDENPELKESARAAIRFVIPKRLDGAEGERRAERQRNYAQRLGLVEGTDPARFKIDFAMVHGGL